MTACLPSAPTPEPKAPVPEVEMTQSETLSVVIAGVPKYLGEARDYEAIFAELSASGIRSFYPTFQYQEMPDARSLGFETDFLPPCTPDDPAFRSLRAYGMKLVVPGEMLYPPGKIPLLDDDPLLDLLTCTGIDGVSAVLSVDEPFGAIRNRRKPYQDVQAIYERVKSIAPDIPVMMVHAPVPAFLEDAAGSHRPVQDDEVEYYLDEVLGFSKYADSFGFDIYPIPIDIALLTTPYQNEVTIDYAATISDYTRWLSEHAEGRPFFIVLQGFSYDRLLNDGTETSAPTRSELRAMVCAAWTGGASEIIWWGTGFLLEEDKALWKDILSVSAEISGDPTLCISTE